MLDDIVLIAHGSPGPPLLLHVLLQLGDVLLGHVGLAQQVHQDGGEVVGGVGGPGVGSVGHDGTNYILQPGCPVLQFNIMYFTFTTSSILTSLALSPYMMFSAIVRSNSTGS